jgi:hypothetical protein
MIWGFAGLLVLGHLREGVSGVDLLLKEVHQQLLDVRQ